LAISEAEVMKLKRKYEVLNDEHKLLRTSYTDLESKTAATEYTVREKLAYSKKNEKELTFFINKILNDVK
jgi:cell division protein FtsB